jgi:hypothetical protein
MMNGGLLLDNEGRRSGADRRVFSYAVHLPERRSGEDRRDEEERRLKIRN